MSAATTGTPAVPKARRWSKRTSAIRAMAHIQRASPKIHMVKGGPFDRILDQMSNDIRADVRKTKEFRAAIRDVVEHWSHDCTTSARRLCQNDKRQVLMPRDIQASSTPFIILYATWCRWIWTHRDLCMSVYVCEYGVVYNRYANDPAMKEVFYEYLKQRTQLELENPWEISTEESEIDWRVQRQKIHEENRRLSGTGKKKKTKKSKNQAKKRSIEKGSGDAEEPVAKKSKVDESEEKAVGEENTKGSPGSVDSAVVSMESVETSETDEDSDDAWFSCICSCISTALDGHRKAGFWKLSTSRRKEEWNEKWLLMSE